MISQTDYNAVEVLSNLDAAWNIDKGTIMIAYMLIVYRLYRLVARGQRLPAGNCDEVMT